jgi:hypothetical protein
MLAMCGSLSDFGKLAPRQERASLQHQLRWEEDEYYNEALECWDSSPVNTPEDANVRAQSLHRYRLIAFSNFLTTVGVVDRFEANLAEILEDAQPGTVVMLIGGKGGSYPEIYEYINRLATTAGFQLKLKAEAVSSDSTEVAGRAFTESAQEYSRLQSLAPHSAGHTEPVRRCFADGAKRAPSSQIWAYRKYSRRRVTRPLAKETSGVNAACRDEAHNAGPVVGGRTRPLRVNGVGSCR